jgi:hypothetical protein
MLDVAFDGRPDDQGNPRACPSGSVPILRITPEQILKAGGLASYIGALSPKDYPMKGNPMMGGPTEGGPTEGGPTSVPPGVPAAPMESGNYAYVTTRYPSGSIIAGQVTLSIFAPFVQGGPKGTQSLVDHSLGQTWLIGSDGIQTVETGWIVSPFVNHGDQTNAHLFVYSTSQGYNVNGCYNSDSSLYGLPCLTYYRLPGAQYTAGMQLPATTFGGSTQTLELYTYFGTAGGSNAWIIYNVGYFPASNYSGTMATGTAHQYYGGYEVYDHSGNWVIPMGSGAASNAGFGQAAYIDLMEAENSNGTWSVNFGGPQSTASAYTAYTGTSGYYFAGDQTKVWWGQDYGDSFSPVGDWASGYYKGQCPNGHAVIGDSCYRNAIQSHAVVCGQQTLATFNGGPTGSGCYARNITNGDNRGYNDNGWDWQVNYIKDECGVNEFVEGLSQGKNGYIHGVLCCPGNVTHQSCESQIFYSSNSLAYGSGPDTDPGYNKGICPNGQYVAGVSQNIPDGGVYSILCCSP